MGRLTAPETTFTRRRQRFSHCRPRRLGELQQALGEDALA
jgi:hypothetical protein